MYKNSASVGRIACRLQLYRVVQLNFTPESEVLHMLTERYLSCLV